MAAGRLTLLLVMYVTLDFANPLMPGAVRFDGDSVTAVHGDRAHVPVPVGPAKLVRRSAGVDDRPRPLHGFSRPLPAPAPRRRHGMTRSPSALLAAADPGPSSEDH
jgi:hypothetical protein